MSNIDEQIQATNEQLERLNAALADIETRMKNFNARLELMAEPYREEIVKLKARAKKLALSKLPICNDCEGSGIVDPGYHNVGAGQCSTCKGTGHIGS